MKDNFKFTSYLDHFIDRFVSGPMDRKMRAAGSAWVAEAVRLCPVDTGQLRDSIGFYYNQQTKTLTLYADKYYAVFVEMGTRRRKATPFMRPALKMIGVTWGGAVDVQFPMTPAKYRERTLKYAQHHFSIKKRHYIRKFGVHVSHRHPVRA